MTSSPQDRVEPALVPFAFPGAAICRETLAGWQAWWPTRHHRNPAPRLGVAEYRQLSPRKQALHDLHRTATHVNLPMLETPMSQAISHFIRTRLQNNALKYKSETRSGIMVSGGGYQGKTETVCDACALFEDLWRELHSQLNPDAVPGTRDLWAPVAYVQTPVTATPKSLCEAILAFYGTPYPARANLPQLCRAVKASLRAHGTRALVLDDITRLKLHREADQDTLDLLRSLMNMNVTPILIGVGIRKSGLLREAHLDTRTGQWIYPAKKTIRPYNDEEADQVERRFDLIDLEPFRYDTPGSIAAWLTHLAGLEDSLRLLRAAPGMLTDGDMPEYLFRRTQGVIGFLERLIEDGCARAIETGTETLTVDLLNGIDLTLHTAAGRDPAAGEIPPIPPAPKQNTPARRKGRNTVFDDHGPSAQPTAG